MIAISENLTKLPRPPGFGWSPILSPTEIEELYGIPNFSAEQRTVYFTLDDVEQQEIESRPSLESRLHFILQLGYFKSN